MFSCHLNSITTLYPQIKISPWSPFYFLMETIAPEAVSNQGSKEKGI